MKSGLIMVLAIDKRKVSIFCLEIHQSSGIVKLKKFVKIIMMYNKRKLVLR
jgi:hypothetical protein